MVDLICHGVPSYLVWDKFLKENGDNREIIFRNKKYGWKKELTVGSKRIRRDKFYNFLRVGKFIIDVAMTVIIGNICVQT